MDGSMNVSGNVRCKGNYQFGRMAWTDRNAQPTCRCTEKGARTAPGALLRLF